MRIKAKTGALLIAAFSAASLLCAGDGRAGVATIVGSLPSPLPTPRFDLAFDSTTDTLWGIENATASANVMNFTLAGSFVSGFLTESNWNNMGIAVNQLAGASKRVYYWQNIARTITEVDESGTLLGSTSLPFGYQNVIRAIGFDPAEGRDHRAARRPRVPGDRSGLQPHRARRSASSRPNSSTSTAQLRMSMFLGFELSADSYWVLGPTAFVDEIVQIDRATLTVVDNFVLPGSSGQTYRGLARDPDTGIFYSNFNDEEIRALTLPEPGAAAGVLALATLALRARRRGLRRG